VTISVLVVDDSGFFRRRVSEILNATREIKVIATATNGKDAVELVKKLHPDVVTMDYEMPVMDGITALKHIMATEPTPVLMFSSLSYEGARVTLDALEAGAVDYLPKNFEDISRDASKMQEILKQRIMSVAKSSVGKNRKKFAASSDEPDAPATHNTALKSTLSQESSRPSSSSLRQTPQPNNRLGAIRTNKPEPVVQKVGAKKLAGAATASPAASKSLSHPISLVAIGTSTGGPIALQKVLSVLPANFPYPILLVQHMPGTFTPAFAERLNNLCQIKVKQAEDGDQLRPGLALLAPGGKQMLVDGRGGAARVRVIPGDERLHYRPCVDVTFGSAARAFPGKTLGIILTGMGADGKEGCRLMKQSGSTIWAQDEKTCVIYGMPAAVVKAGFASEILPLQNVGSRIVEACM
jgi:two-component system chemotaxis response regulator CheB